MRLWNTETEIMEVGQFFGHRIPTYAVLSHRWEQEELSYQDLPAGRNRDGAGLTKVQKCRMKALTDGDGFKRGKLVPVKAEGPIPWRYRRHYLRFCFSCRRGRVNVFKGGLRQIIQQIRFQSSN